MENNRKVLDSLSYGIIDKYNELIAKLKEFLVDGKKRKLVLDMDEEGVPYTYLDEDYLPQNVQLSKIRYDKEFDDIEVFDILSEEWLLLIDMGISNTSDIISTIQWEDD